MFVLWSGKSNKELSPVVSRNEIFAILKSLCSTAREEMCARLEGFVETRQLEKLFDEQEQDLELYKWEKYDIRKTNRKSFFFVVNHFSFFLLL
jgi:hypothetical protein